jgi:hypothetical protein
MQNDPVADGARAAADLLATRYGATLRADVEATLAAGNSGRQLDKYLDPIGLASLIVSIASLAWAVYVSVRKESASPSEEEVLQRVREELASRGSADSSVDPEVSKVVVREVIQAVKPGKPEAEEDDNVS